MSAGGNQQRQQQQQQYDDYDSIQSNVYGNKNNGQQQQQYQNFNALQQQFLQKQQNTMTVQSQLDNYNVDTNFGTAASQYQSNLVSGRFPQQMSGPNQVDSYRNMGTGGFNMQTPSQQTQKGAIATPGALPQQMQPQSQQQQTDLNMMSQYSIKDGGLSTPSASNIGAFGGNPNMFGAINQGLQPNLLQELLKMQGNNNNQQMLGVNQLGQQQQHQQIQQQQNQPLFGQGFMNAASLLANIQQLQQPSDKSPPTPVQQQPIGGAQNMMALQQFLSLNSNLNQYQSFIDQIEKQQQPTAAPQPLSQYSGSTAFGGLIPSNARVAQQQQQQSNSQVSSPIQNMPSYSSSLPTQAPSYMSSALPTTLNSSMLPSQSDLIRQPLKASVANYHEMIENAGLPQHQNYSYLMNNKQPAIEINDQENYGGEKTNSKHDNYMYQEVKNTVSNPTIKERHSAYNPQAYTGKPTINPTLSGDEFSYDGQMPASSYSVQRSPTGAQKINIPTGGGNRRNDGESPKVQWLTGNNTRSTQNEPLSYLSNGNNNKFSEGQSSPHNRNSGSRGMQPDLYGNNPIQLDNSLNQGMPNQNIYHQLNASQNSSQIDTGNNQFYKKASQFQNQHQQQQYSPGSSNYRFDDVPNPHDQVNSSINFGKSQKISNNNMSQQAVNIDDIPVGPTRPKTFEELLEENLRKMGQNPSDIVVPDNTNTFNRGEEEERHQKKEFLKRKSQKATVTAAPSKKYNYYVDNFDENKKKEPRSTSAAPERSTGFTKTNNVTSNNEEAPIYQKAPPQHKNHLESTPNHNRAVSPMDNYNDRSSADNSNQPGSKPAKLAQKKTFLTRGSGTAGGKQGHSNPPPAQKVNPKQKQSQKKGNNALLSDDEYPNDFNFAAEQDNKSPKLVNQQQSYLSRQANVASKRNNNNIDERNSIAEFEKLEQECSKSTTQIQQQRQVVGVAAATAGNKKGNQRRKKLFDDSDSNDNDDDEEEEQQHNLSHHIEESKAHNKSGLLSGSQHGTSENEDGGKSSIVKKFFYKEDPKKPPSQIPRIPLSQQHATPSEQLSSQLEAAMRQKMEQLDRAIETYNQQSEMAQKMKREYESLVQKQRVDYREFEGKKRRDQEEIERIRNEEIDKIKKEKKALEQRQRNMNMVQTSNKKEREEIEFLKRELQRVVEENKAKEGKAKAQIERLTKLTEEMKQRNKELQDELKHVNDQFKSSAPINQKPNPNNISGSSASQQAAAAASRYTFSSNKSQELLHQQQPKGILKNTNDNNRPVASNYFYDQPLEEDDENEEEEEDARQINARGSEDEDDNRDGEHHNQSEEDEQHQQQQMSRGNQPNLNNNSSNSRQRIEDSRLQQQHPQINTSGIVLQNHPSAAPTSNEEEENEEFDMKFPMQYHSKTPVNMKVVEQIIGNDGKIQRVYENGKKEVIFNNGVKREVFPDGYTIVYFNNNDIKQTYADQRVVYYFAEARTTQTTFPDGLQVFKFANNQIEKHFPDGTKEIIFPDGTIKCIFADGEEESIFPDGTIQRIEKNGVKAIEFANGQKDIMFPDGTKIREYPDGKVRKTFPDGKTEYTHRPQQP